MLEMNPNFGTDLSKTGFSKGVFVDLNLLIVGMSFVLKILG